MIQTYPIVERAVYAGAALAISTLLSDVSNFNKPEIVVETISDCVMSELNDVLDFGVQPLRFSDKLKKEMWTMAQEQAEQEAAVPPPPAEKPA